MWRDSKPPMLTEHVRRRRPDDYTLAEKAVIARLIVTPGVRLPCPRCEGQLTPVDWPRGEGVEVVLEFRCMGCTRRVLLVNVPAAAARAS